MPLVQKHWSIKNRSEMEGFNCDSESWFCTLVLMARDLFNEHIMFPWLDYEIMPLRTINMGCNRLG